MKKNVLAMSIAAMIGGLGFAGAASASVIVGTGGAALATALVPAGQTTVTEANSLMLTPDITSFKVAEGGVGHALIVPYYTAQNGNMTVLHLTNTDMVNGKVAKIRFRGAANSDDVLDFQVLLSPGDVWTAAVVKGSDGFANLVTGDGTCTIPALTKGVAVPFLDTRLNPALTVEQRAEQTREGYVEIFNSADIPSNKVFTIDGVNGKNSALYTAIKHVSGVAPCTSTAINAALYTADLTNEGKAVALGLGSPTGGLMGDWYIINVPATTTYSGATTALVGVGGKIGNFTAFPQNDAIVINTPEIFTADPALRAATKAYTKKNDDGTATTATTKAVITAIALDFPDMSTPYYAAATDANALAQAENLTQQLAVSSVTNQYAKDTSISAKTDWVFSMPTRRYSVAMDYLAKNSVNVTTPAPVYSLVKGTVGGAAATTATLQYFSDYNVTVDAGKLCVGTQGSAFYDREETAKAGKPVFSPSKAASTRLCGETSVLSFGEGVTAASVLGATIAREDVAAANIFENGWGVITTSNYGSVGAVGDAVAKAGDSIGLPILGFSVIKLTNPQASTGVSGNYGITWAHRFTKVN